MPSLSWLLHRQAAINSRRISVLRRSSRQCLALAAGNAVLPLPSRSGRPSPHAVAPAVSPPVLGSGGSVHPDPLVSGLPLRSQVVAPLTPSLSGGVSSAGVSRFGLMVRRLGRRSGCSLGDAHHFRPLESRRKPTLHQRQGASGRAQGSPPLPVISSGEDHLCLLRQLHGGVLPPQVGRHEVSIPQLSGSGSSVWAESLSIRLAPQFILGSLNVLADTLSRLHQLPHTEWSLNPEVFRSLSRLWPVQVNLFATSENHQCSIYFSPFRDPVAAGTDAFLQPWDSLQAYAFPPWSIIPRILAKLRESRGTELTLVVPYWTQRAWFPDLLYLSLAPLPLRQTSCACLDLAVFTRVSPGCVFMPGDSPALHAGSQFLFHSSLPGFLVAMSIFAQGLSAQLASLQVLVPLPRSHCLSTFPG